MPSLSGKQVGAIGYGLMGLTWRPSPLSDEISFKAMKAALAHGANFWNGGEFYGPPDSNSLTLLNRYFTKYPEDADKVVLSIKGGVNPATLTPDGSEEGVKRSVELCLKLLDGKKSLDFFECARVDPNTPIEQTISYLASYVKSGKIGGIMLSETKADTIRRAHKVHPISGVEIELSLWETECLTNGVAETCAELGIPIVAYSPIGRGILTGQIKSRDDLADTDPRKHYPRFQPGAFETNLKLVSQCQALAQKKSCTPAQLAIAWTLARSNRTFKNLVVIPIPGASAEERVNENSQAAKVVEWTEGDEREVKKILKEFEVVGGRYPEGHAKYLLA